MDVEPDLIEGRPRRRARWPWGRLAIWGLFTFIFVRQSLTAQSAFDRAFLVIAASLLFPFVFSYFWVIGLLPQKVSEDAAAQLRRTLSRRRPETIWQAWARRRRFR